MPLYSLLQVRWVAAMPRRQTTERDAALVLVFASVAAGAGFVAVAASRQVTGMEGALFQTLSLGLGLVGSWLFGRQSARVAARELIKPHARSAFRRLVSLYGGLSRLAAMLDSARRSRTPGSECGAVLEKLAAVVEEHIMTADDAMEDWRDIAPEDVEALRQQIQPRNGGEG
jgi:hypothetical protein